jgi:tRNA dimethylallyltransferase
MNESRRIIVVAGPTASGKSDFAVQLALKNNGEIISADSRQVYIGLDIGTGKITAEEMKGVPHYMLDIVNVGDEFSVGEYARRAKPILEDIFARGKTPIICGGTGQYIDALVYDVQMPPVGPNLALRAELEKKDVDELYKELAEKDPYRADDVDRYNKVRLIRALEIVHELGFVPPLHEPTLICETELYLMNPTRELVRQRIEKRLLARLENGMLEECKRLLANGVTHEQLEKLGLEYRYMSRHLRGEITYAEMVEELKNKICQYAKRQDTWNKKYLPIAKVVEVQ